MEVASARYTCFEMMHRLYISMRMLFGLVNSPAVFARNADVMLGDLKFKTHEVLNYFDDILGGVKDQGDWNRLLQLFVKVLNNVRSHGWKFKPVKLKYGWREINVFGMIFEAGLVKMGPERLSAVDLMRVPFSKSEVMSVLGLANCFRDRIPGYSLRVEASNELTRSKEKTNASLSDSKK